MATAACPKCGHDELLDGVRLGDALDAHDVSVVVEPTTGMIRRQTTAALRATVCAGCGFTELHVPDPAAIAERWRAGER